MRPALCSGIFLPLLRFFGAWKVFYKPGELAALLDAVKEELDD